ncbi:scyllo-inositol 2-dehydrogenase (NAD(+)) [Diplonema papillatum]|nr:scyllo-inositol 2-dehydrogenase (NAD(+)) [Diplonema papillatum]
MTAPLPNALLVGTGEYTTGWTGGGGSKSDKSMGVVALVHFDLRNRKLTGDRIALCGTSGTKFAAIREHMKSKIDFVGLNTEFDQFPAADVASDPKSYETAVKDFKPGDVCSVFTPDSTHYDIAMAALEHGLHVMVTKPIVKTLKSHLNLVQKAREKGVLLQVEVHKRFDPVYSDANNRIKTMGEFNYFVSYMSQPKFQLETFRAWAGISSDISYYLNSHHIDFHVWAMQGVAKPVSVRAIASNGIAEKVLGRPCEDTITLTTIWKNNSSGNIGTAVYTASWVAGKADVHSQQRFFCLMEKGEISADQAHRGYTLADDNGFSSLNPLYIRNTPDSKGRYCGRRGYGYISFEEFVTAANSINNKEARPEDFDTDLPTAHSTLQVTAILEAGRLSLDNGNKDVVIQYNDEGLAVDLQIQ